MVRISDVIDRSEINRVDDRTLLERIKPPSEGVRLSVEDKFSADEIYKALIRYMEESGARVQKGEPFAIKKGAKFIDFLISRPPATSEGLHRLTLLSAGREKDSYANHAANVTINALLLGKSLGYVKPQMISLGAAALFHELGMYRLPASIRNKHGKLTESEFKVMRSHCEISSREVLRYGEQYREAAEIILQEHERIDGSGYPRGLKGAEIHESASIIGILDIYDALVNSRSYRKGLLPSEAMKEIIRRCKGLFPSLIIKRLLKILSVYPVKTYVRLNNNSIGMVIKINPLWPLKPTVNLIFDAQGRRVVGEKLMDLVDNPLLYIKDVVQEEDVLVK